MKVIIPAAGFATRLYPLTLNIPKHLLDVGNKKMIEHVMDKLMDIDEIDHIIIATNARYYEPFVEWESTYQSIKPITILNNGVRQEDKRLGAIGDMHFAIKSMNIYDDILIIAGDNLWDFDLADMIKYFREVKSSIIAVRDLKKKSVIANRFGCVEIDKEKKIIGFKEKPEHPKTTLTATMMYLFRKEDLHHLNNIMKEGAPDNAGEFIEYLSEKVDVHTFIFTESWYDIGSLENLEKVSSKFND